MAKRKKKDQLPPAISPSEFICMGCGSTLKGAKTLKHPKGSCAASGKEYRRPTFQLIEA